MLPRVHRLRHTRDVSRVYRSRSLAHGALFDIRTRHRQDAGPTRVGFVVSRRVSKKATERNRIARRARASVGDFLPHLVSGRDVLVIARGVPSAFTHEAVVRDLHKGFSTLHLLST